MNLVKLSPSAYASFFSSLPCANFLQSPEMYSRYQSNHTPAFLLGQKNSSGDIISAALARSSYSRFGRILKLAGGPLLDYDRADALDILNSFLDELKLFARSHGFIAVKFSPYLLLTECDNNGAPVTEHREPSYSALYSSLSARHDLRSLGEDETAKWIYVIDVAGKSEAELYSALRRNHKRLIKRAEACISIRDLSFDELPILKKIAAAAGERHGFADPELSYYEEMFRAFGDHARFRVCEYTDPASGEILPIMAAMFLYSGDEIICPYSGSLKEYQHYGAPQLLHWEMIKEAHKKGYRRYNLLGTHPVAGSGVFQFKQGFSGHIDELFGSFLLPVSFRGRLYSLPQHYHKYGDLH